MSRDFSLPMYFAKFTHLVPDKQAKAIFRPDVNFVEIFASKVLSFDSAVLYNWRCEVRVNKSKNRDGMSSKSWSSTWNILAHESLDQMSLIHEKNWDTKINATSSFLLFKKQFVIQVQLS